MVFILDEGSEFDAPIDKIWKYLSSEDHVHTSIKILNSETFGNVATVTYEGNMMGKTVVMKVRNTVFPPIGRVQEYLEGPMQGSKAFLYYIPKGNKTGVTVVGDYVMSGGVSEQAIRDAVGEQGQRFFDEDNANLKAIK
jgi:hypothetical protein